MKTIFSHLLSLLAIFSPLSLTATNQLFELLEGDYKIAVGPEAYHMKRIRPGGIKQKGWLYGARGVFENIAPFQMYFGIEAACAKGTLKGQTGAKNPLKSRFSDACLEGRVGYTLKSPLQATLTPFVGMGYFTERNCTLYPSPIQARFFNRFCYLAFGVLSKFTISPGLTIGIDITGKYSLDGKIRVTDKEVGNSTLHYEHKLHCRVCVPLIWAALLKGCEMNFCLNPFYEYRHFGGHNRVPFNFLDTRLKIHGLDLFFIYRF